jgi:dolichol-phosphate mannosyltransferase
VQRQPRVNRVPLLANSSHLSYIIAMDNTLVIIPTYNEKENITRIIPAVFQSVAQNLHILVVDDGSPDGTAALVKELIPAYPDKLNILERKEKNGLGPAYIAGFRWALERDYNRVIEFDADFSHDPQYLPAMIELSGQKDFVVASRYVRSGGVEGWGPMRKFISRGGSLYAQIILLSKIRDMTGGFNLWNRNVLAAYDFDNFVAKGYVFQIEMKYRAQKMGFKGVELPIIFKDRTAGESKMSGQIFFEAAKKVLQLKREV